MVSTELLRVSKEFEVSYLKHSEDDKTLFLSMWSKFKEVSPKDREQRGKELRKVGESIKSDTARRAYNSMVNMCMVYTYLPDRYVNLTNIEYEVLKRVLILVKRVVNNYNDGVNGLESIGKIWVSGMSPSRYNNLLMEEVKKLGEKYPVPEKVPQVTYDTVVNEVRTLNTEDKEKLLLQLMEELGYEVADEREVV